jgi:hypothetical protein
MVKVFRVVPRVLAYWRTICTPLSRAFS